MQIFYNDICSNQSTKHERCRKDHSKSDQSTHQKAPRMMHTIIKRAVLAAIVLLIETTSNSSFPMMFFVRCVCEEAIHTHLSCTHTHTAMINKGIFWKAKLSNTKFSPKIKIVFIFPRVELHGTPSHNRAFCLSLRTPFIARINPSGLVMSW